MCSIRYPEYEIVGDEDISKTASISKRYSDQSLSGIITDIHFLSLSDYLVCTFSSQVCEYYDSLTLLLFYINMLKALLSVVIERNSNTILIE